MAQNAPYSPPRPGWRRLWTLFRPDLSDVLAVAIFSVITGALLLATPVAVQTLVDFVAFGAAVPSLIVLSLLLMAALSLGAALFGVQTWIVEILQRRVFVRLVSDLADRLPRLSHRVRETYHQPELVNRFFDVVTIQKVGSTLLLDGMANLLSAGVGMTVLAFYHPLLLAFVIGMLVLILALFLIPLRRGNRTAVAESTAKYEIAGWLEEIARHRVTFKYSGSESFVQRRSEEVASRYVAARRTHFHTVFTQILGALGLQVLTTTALLGIGGWLVVIGELTLGQLVAANLLVAVVGGSVAKLGTLAEKYYDLIAATGKVGKLLDLDVENGVAGGGAHVHDAPVRVETRGLVLPGVGANLRSDPIDLIIEPGAVVGITGAHGAGKSALLDVMFRLREPKEGSVLLDGMHCADHALDDYRRHVALASEPELLEVSILENVTLGRPGLSTDHVGEVMRAVGLSEPVQRLSRGLSTDLLPNGAPLSPGQQSRLMLARALAGRPRLLLVDELLDDLSESGLASVNAAIFNRRAEQTVLIASGRREVLERCDFVIDLSEGLE